MPYVEANRRCARAFQHRYDRTLSHDQPKDEARRDAELLEARGYRAFEHKALETQA